ncbi:MAG TPA: phospholipid methyltransferase [Aliidongia sp.]|nr:phospholipid methyltransferase [Aliidongia sp.]
METKTERATLKPTHKSSLSPSRRNRLQAAATRLKRGNSATLFFLQWLRAPGQMGAVVPSSRRLADAMARQIPMEARQDAAPIVELGGGTGSITRGILDAGIPSHRLIVLERDSRLADLLAKRFPGITVLCGDAQNLQALLAERGITRVAAVLSGLPLLLFPEQARCRVVDACFAVLPPGRPLIQFTYGFAAPLPPHEHLLHARRVARVIRNVPPAFVWTFKKAA